MKKLEKISLLILVIFLVVPINTIAFDLDPGPGGGGGGGSTKDTRAPYIAILSPTDNVISHFVTIKASASDNVGVTKVKFYIDGVYKASDTSSYYTYTWDLRNYDECSTHTVKAVAYDAAGNSRSTSRTYTIGYIESVSHFKYLYGSSGEIDEPIDEIAYTKIESDIFGLALIVNLEYLQNGGNTMDCKLHVVTIYTYIGERENNNLNPKPLSCPIGTLVEINLEVEKIGSNDAIDNSEVEVHNGPQDRLVWPNAMCLTNLPSITGNDIARTAISTGIALTTSYLKIGMIGSYLISTFSGHVLDNLFPPEDDELKIFYGKEDSIDIQHRNWDPNAQNVLYPDGGDNYAYDFISYNYVTFRYYGDEPAIQGETIGLKFHLNAEYADTRDDYISRINSEWVKLEFVIN